MDNDAIDNMDDHITSVNDANIQNNKKKYIPERKGRGHEGYQAINSIDKVNVVQNQVSHSVN